ncbi:CARDB domain-containing protein [Actinoplanes sp. CA-131856]
MTVLLGGVITAMLTAPAVAAPAVPAPAAAATRTLAYVLDISADVVKVIDVATRAITATVRVGPYPLFLAMTKDAANVYVTNNSGNSVSRIDTATNTVTRNYPVNKPKYIAVSPDGAKVYTSSDNVVASINTATGATVTKPIGTYLRGLVVSPDNATVYALESTTGDVLVLDAATLAVTSTISVTTSTPGAIALSPDGQRLAVSNIHDNTVSVVDTTNGTVTGTAPVTGPNDVSYSADGSRLFLSGSSSGLTIVDTSDNTIEANVPLPAGTYTVAPTPDGKQVYLSNFQNHLVYVVDVATEAVVSTLSGFAIPYGIAIGDVPVPPSADLDVTITESADPATLGEEYSYTVTVGNKGPSAATGVTGKVALSGAAHGLRASSTRGACTTAVDEVTCPLGTLAKDATATITVTIETEAAGTITATATVDATETDPAAADNTATATTSVTTSADLGVTLADSPDTVALGGTYTYTATVSNKGPSPASGVTAKIMLSGAARTIRSATSTRGSCTTAAAVVTCPIGALDRAGTATITVIVEPQADGTITAGASVDATEPDPVTDDNTATETTTVTKSADLAVTLADSPDPAALGSTYTYTATVTNKGPSAASAVVAKVALSGAGRTILTVTSSQGTCTMATNEATCAVGGLATDGSATITVTVEPLAVGTVTAVATVAGAEPDPVAANSTVTTTTTVANTHHCTILGTVGLNLLAGTSGNDVICAFGGNDMINANGGNDIVYAGSGNDSVSAGDGNDTVYGGDGNDAVNGENGTDTIDGGPGTDTANGGPGTDTCTNVETRISCP